MFVNKSQLRHLLKPYHYRSESHYQTEIEKLFRPGWHFVGTTADLKKNGDFLTTELFGYPVLVRNFEGEVRAFLNVCGHRHCMLTNLPRGSAPNLRCQYHGWEYTKDGNTGRIPDAQSFRPFDRENTRLKAFRLDRCGELLFVSLIDDDGPSLAEYLGPLHDEFAVKFAPPFKAARAWQIDYAANWKVPLENSLEGYHIPQVHPKTFGNYAEEKFCSHDLDPRYTTYRQELDNPLFAKPQAWLTRRLGEIPTNTYTHHHLHPNITFSGLDVYSLLQVVVPTGPTTSRGIIQVYVLRGHKRGPFAALIAAVLKRFTLRTAWKILMEDFSIFTSQQKGLEASPHPGCIGVREERIYMFQNWLLENCGPIPGEEWPRLVLKDE